MPAFLALICSSTHLLILGEKNSPCLRRFALNAKGVTA